MRYLLVGMIKLVSVLLAHVLRWVALKGVSLRLWRGLVVCRPSSRSDLLHLRRSCTEAPVTNANASAAPILVVLALVVVLRRSGVSTACYGGGILLLWSRACELLLLSAKILLLSLLLLLLSFKLLKGIHPNKEILR